MKKRMIKLLSLALSFVLTFVPVASAVVPGDVDGDGLITVKDLSAMKRMIAG